jgi:hypothetical protein
VSAVPVVVAVVAVFVVVVDVFVVAVFTTGSEVAGAGRGVGACAEASFLALLKKARPITRKATGHRLARHKKGEGA